MNAVAPRLVTETAISSGMNGPGLNGKVQQTSTFDIAAPNIPAGRRLTAAWYNVVGNFRELGLFQTIKVEPVVNANGQNSVRLSFHANEEPCHVVIQIFAEGE
jgi:hypothetical protein